MGKQSNKVQKRRRREAYIKRRKQKTTKGAGVRKGAAATA